MGRGVCWGLVMVGTSAGAAEEGTVPGGCRTKRSPHLRAVPSCSEGGRRQRALPKRASDLCPWPALCAADKSRVRGVCGGETSLVGTERLWGALVPTWTFVLGPIVLRGRGLPRELLSDTVSTGRGRWQGRLGDRILHTPPPGHSEPGPPPPGVSHQKGLLARATLLSTHSGAWSLGERGRCPSGSPH